MVSSPENMLAQRLQALIIFLQKLPKNLAPIDGLECEFKYEITTESQEKITDALPISSSFEIIEKMQKELADLIPPELPKPSFWGD